jgi:hypothetical protein
VTSVNIDTISLGYLVVQRVIYKWTEGNEKSESDGAAAKRKEAG